LSVCFMGKDWDGALEVFEWMSGYQAADFADPVDPSSPSRSRPYRQQAGLIYDIEPNVETLAMLTRTAWGTRDVESIRQCLRIASHLSPSVLAKRSARKQAFESYYVSELAKHITRLIHLVEGDVGTHDTELQSWTAMRKQWKAAVQAEPSQEFLVPKLEKGLMGTQSSRGRMEETIDFQMANRQL